MDHISGECLQFLKNLLAIIHFVVREKELLSEGFSSDLFTAFCNLAHHIRYDDTDTLTDIVETLTAIIDTASRPDSDGDQEETEFEHNDNQFREEPADVVQENENNEVSVEPGFLHAIEFSGQGVANEAATIQTCEDVEMSSVSGIRELESVPEELLEAVRPCI